MESSPKLAGFLAGLKHRARLWRLGLAADGDYRQYLKVQFNRTFSKRNQVPARRISVVMDRLVELGAPGLEASVLCIGPRDGFELDWFRDKGFTKVCGIDLFSRRPDILVMDMHSMTFPADSFDVVYASHSLEHSYDVRRVVGQIIRVARPHALIAVEVPIKFTPRGADRFDFEGVEGICRLFRPWLDRVLWSDEQAPGSPLNASGTAVARAVFFIRKARSESNDG